VPAASSARRRLQLRGRWRRWFERGSASSKMERRSLTGPWRNSQVDSKVGWMKR
jgi:hypothetical protein